jgi:hypothetical protein
MKVTMTVKQAKALVAVVCEDDTRWFANVVYVTDTGMAVVSDSCTLIKMHVKVEGWERDTHIRGTSLATALKVAVAKKDTTVVIECTQENTMGGSYPPYASAFTANAELIGSFDAKLLVEALKAMQAANTEKHCIVDIYRDRSNALIRPFELRSTDATMLVVPVKR